MCHTLGNAINGCLSGDHERALIKSDLVDSLFAKSCVNHLCWRDKPEVNTTTRDLPSP